MKIYLWALLAAVYVAITPSQAQTATKFRLDDSAISWIEIRMMVNKTRWNSYYDLSRKYNFKLLSGREEADNYIRVVDSLVKMKVPIPMVEPMVLYKNKVAELLNNLPWAGSFDGFLNSEPHSPVKFANFENKPAFLVLDAASSDVYNTLKLTARQRASRIITSCILPAFREYCRYLDDRIPYYGLIVTFGSRNFLEDDSTKAESVAVIASAAQVKKYASNELTEDELVENASIYLSDRDESGSDIKKIKIILD